VNDGSSPGREPATVAVVIPCWNDGDFLPEAIGSLRDDEGLECVVVDDGSTDPKTVDVLRKLEASGVRVIRQGANLGVSAARNRGLAETSAPYVFPLDADDLAIPGAIAKMRARLDEHPEAAVCYGDSIDFGIHELVRAVPATLDPYRLRYANEYPMTALYRRSALEQLGGWQRLLPEIDSRQDWNLWLSLAESGAGAVYAGEGFLTHAYRTQAARLSSRGRAHHRRLSDALAAQHPGVFTQVRLHRRRSSLSRPRRILYPFVYGRRRRSSLELRAKVALDRLGIWTLTGEMTEEQRRQLARALAAGAAEARRLASM